MTTVSNALYARRLPAWVPAVTAIGAAALALVLFKVLGLLGGGWVLTAVGAVLLFLAGLVGFSTVVEGGRGARNRLPAALVFSAFTLGPLPPISVVVTLVSEGAS